MKYFVIGDEETVLGFGLAGVSGSAVTGSESAAESFERALMDRSIGIILITERAAESIRARVNFFLFSADFPLVVEIPDRHGPMPGRKNLRETANDAIGIKL